MIMMEGKTRSGKSSGTSRHRENIGTIISQVISLFHFIDAPSIDATSLSLYLFFDLFVFLVSETIVIICNYYGSS